MAPAALACLAVLCAFPLAAAAEAPLFLEREEAAAREMTERAIAEFDTHGIGALNTIQNAPLFREGGLYAFVVSQNHTVLAHSANPGAVGGVLSNMTGASGASLGDMFRDSASPYGAWVPYREPDRSWDPRGGPNLLWIKERWGHVFGAGISVDPSPDSTIVPGGAAGGRHTGIIDYEGSPSFVIHISQRDRDRMTVAQEMVEYTIPAYAADPVSTVDAIGNARDPMFVDGEIYVIVISHNGTVLAHGLDQGRVGHDLRYIEDTRGVNLRDLFLDNASPFGEWVMYHWKNPVREEEGGSVKLTWIKNHAGFLFAAGIYPESPDEETEDELSWLTLDRRDSARAMIQNAMDAFREDPDDAAAAIHDMDNMKYRDGGLYPIVVDGGGNIVAHGGSPELAGTSIHDITGARGTNLGELFDAATPYGVWSEYYRPGAGGRTDTPVTMLLVSGGGYAFGAGVNVVHPDDAHAITQEQRGQQSRARDMVEHAIASFTADAGDTISEINSMTSPLYRDGDTYTFVVAANGTMLAHGADQNLVGDNMYYIRDVWGVNIGELIEENRSAYGRWVEHHWPKPSDPSDGSQIMLTWMKHHEGYTFGAGVFIDP